MRYDVAVIGAGSAGAVIATRLSEDPHRSVVLIEAGPDYPDFATLPDQLKFGRATAAYVTTTDHLWSLVARATDGAPPTPLPRGRVVGGTSAINGQVYLRAVVDDFRVWAEECPLWSFDEVLPFFKAMERDLDFANEWHGSDGPVPVRRYRRDEWLPAQQAFVDACQELGHPYCADANAPGAVGVGPIPFNNVDGIRASTAVTYLASARDRDNLTIMADTFVRRLRLRGPTVVAAEAETPAGPIVIEAESYVISAGAIGSPHLLMLSGIGPADQLRAAGVEVNVDLPGVGQNLRDHQLVDLVWPTHPGPPARGWRPLVQTVLRYTSTDAEFVDDMQITVRSAAPGRSDEPLVALVPSIEHSAAVGSVTLTSADPHVQPSIDLRFLGNDRDLRRMKEAVGICHAIAATAPFAGLLDPSGPFPDISEQTLTSWLRAHVRTSHHVSGTCRMGSPNDPGTVVDQWGRVLGTDNLSVADASVFPDVIRANLNATAMMVGERIASFLRCPSKTH